DDTTVNISVSWGQRHAQAATNQLDPASVRGALRRAAQLARLAPENPEHMPVLGPQTYLPAQQLFDPATAALDAAARAAAASKALAAAADAKLELAGFLEHSASALLLGNSAGLRAWSTETDVSLTMTARTDDGSGSGWAGAESRRVAEIDAASLARVAVDK